MIETLNSNTLQQMSNNNKLNITQLIGSLNFTKLSQTLKIIKTLKRNKHNLISTQNYKKLFTPYIKSLKNHITPKYIPNKLSYSYRLQLNKFYSLCDDTSKQIFNNIILSLRYCFEPKEIINFFSNIV